MAPHGVYPANGSDNWLTLDGRQRCAVASSLCRLAAGQSWVANTDYATASGRQAHAQTLDAEIAAWTKTFDRDTLASQLREAGLASFPVQSMGGAAGAIRSLTHA